MALLKVVPIGHVAVDQAGFRLVIKPAYRAALLQLEQFGHIQIIWWFNQCDNQKSRNVLTVNSPYRNAPTMGTFATRSTERPNPIALTCSQIA